MNAPYGIGCSEGEYVGLSLVEPPVQKVLLGQSLRRHCVIDNSFRLVDEPFPSAEKPSAEFAVFTLL